MPAFQQSQAKFERWNGQEQTGFKKKPGGPGFAESRIFKKGQLSSEALDGFLFVLENIENREQLGHHQDVLHLID